MAGWRQAVELAMTGEEIETLTGLSRSRTEPASRVSRAAMLLGYGFDNAWEIVPGVWTEQIWYQDRMLAERTFTVSKPERGDRFRRLRSTWRTISPPLSCTASKR